MYKIITARSASELAQKVTSMYLEDWIPEGSHTVVTTLSENTYAGNQHKRTLHTVEYAQTMIKTDPQNRG